MGKGIYVLLYKKNNKKCCYDLSSTCAQVCQELQGTMRASPALYENSDGKQMFDNMSY